MDCIKGTNPFGKERWIILEYLHIQVCVITLVFSNIPKKWKAYDYNRLFTNNKQLRDNNTKPYFWKTQERWKIEWYIIRRRYLENYKRYYKEESNFVKKLPQREWSHAIAQISKSKKKIELPDDIQWRIMVNLYKHKSSKSWELQVQGDDILIKFNA